MDITIRRIRRIDNSWLVEGYTDSDDGFGDAVEVSVDDDGLLDLLKEERNKCSVQNVKR